MPESEQLVYRASSYSNGGNGCVEPAPHRNGVKIRDSKDPDGPTIEFTHSQWAQFLSEVANGLTCSNGAVTISTEELVLIYNGTPKITCWHLHTVETYAVLHFTAQEQKAFLLGVQDGEFNFHKEGSGPPALAVAS